MPNGKKTAKGKSPATLTRKAKSSTKAGAYHTVRGVSPLRVRLHKNASSSAFSHEAQQVFSSGVKKALRELSKQGISVTIKTDKGIVTGVPKISSHGRFSITESVDTDFTKR
jgi:hypothetical protein